MGLKIMAFIIIIGYKHRINTKYALFEVENLKILLLLE